MKLVSVVFGAVGNHGTGTAAILRRVGIDNGIELRDPIDKRCKASVLTPARFRKGVVNIIEQKIVLERIDAVDMEASRAPNRDVAGCWAARHNQYDSIERKESPCSVF